jgi:hypothetical protein
MKIRTFLLGFASLIVALCAAFFSVTGLAKLFAGASFEVMIMAGSLEFAKLITASFLYVYWTRISKVLKFYLTFGVVVLILITSLGIYGFLTSAYQTTADELGIIDSKVGLVELKKQRFQSQLDLSLKERESVNQTITSLSTGITSAINQSVDRQTGQLVTSVSTQAQRTINAQLNESRIQRDNISKQIESLSDSIAVLDQQVFNVKAESKVAGEIGPLRYLSEITGMEMNMIVNLFALLIVFVFDPLAVSLVIAFNAAMKLDKEEKFNEGVKKHDYKIYGDEPTDEIKMDKKIEPPVIVNRVVLSSDDNEVKVDNIPSDEDKLDALNKLSDMVMEYELKTDSTKDDDGLSNLKIDTSRRGVDIDGDGQIDGYDTNGDGLIDEPTPNTARRAQYVMKQKPFYARPDFNWNDREKWIYDQNAINYYLTHVKRDDVNKYLYPEDFYTKTY